MDEGNNHIKNGFLRADQIDLKSLDEQLQRHLNVTNSSARRARSFDKNTNYNINLSINSGFNFNTRLYDHRKPNHHDQNNHGDEGNQESIHNMIPRLRIDTNVNKQRQDWEIEPLKLVIKSVIARGSFGTVHRGVYI